MKRIRRFYELNAIVQFLISYIAILLLALLIVSYGFGQAFEIVKADTENSYITMLQHNVSILDNEKEKMQSLALEVSTRQSIRDVAQYEKGDKGYAMIANRAINEMNQSMNFQTIELLGKYYIYFYNMDRVLFESSYYRPEIFERYLSEWGVSMEEWKASTLEYSSQGPYYHRSGTSLEYVFPFYDRPGGERLGVLAFRLNEKVLKKYLNFPLVYMYDKQGTFLWSSSDGESIDYFASAREPDQYYEYGERGVVWTSSASDGWRYLLSIPQVQALKRLSVLKRNVYGIFGLAIFLGVLVSVIMAVQKGKPMDELWKILNLTDKGRYDGIQLGETVKKILGDHQELLKEFDKEKPALQKAFFYDLLKGEFDTQEQMEWAARKAEIQMKGSAYLVTAFDLFTSNDLYLADAQTLEEVQIITGFIQKYLDEKYHDRVWFYKKNYKSGLIIIENGEKGQVLTFLTGLRKQLEQDYSVETNWGISLPCGDLMLLWKSAEEAMISLKHCEKRQIVGYSPDLEKENEFYFPQIAFTSLENSLHSGNEEKTMVLLELVREENRKRNLDRHQIINLNRKINQILQRFPESGETAPDEKWILWLNELVMQTEVSLEEYFDRFSQICRMICVQNAKSKKQQRKEMIEEVQDYLKEHFAESDMGLAKAGARFRISEGYLSSMFKEQAGINFADYLEGIRIEKACELLNDGNNTVSSVAEKVGYNNVQTFRRAFKRVKGGSPGKMRAF